MAIAQSGKHTAIQRSILHINSLNEPSVNVTAYIN